MFGGWSQEFMGIAARKMEILKETSIYLVGGIPTPLKNDGIRQLGSWHSQLFLESHKIPWFQSTNQVFIVDLW